ncbi:recombinase family protein [Micromonospora sp. NPDC005215]|uniref:recombinase family protein n=1 Tax=Micromonospora sp. NPDC005215 TaxID=3157024 RepID=UPI0033B84FA0
MTANARRAAAYLRRSAARKAADRNATIIEQREEIHGYADDNALTILKEFNEGEGRGASRQSRKARPAFEAAMSALRSGEVDVILVYELSRADRRGIAGAIEFVDVLAAQGRGLIEVDSDLDTRKPADRGRVIAKFEAARDETERLSKRVARTKRRRKAAGAWLGGTLPLGMAAEHDADGAPTGRVVRSADWPRAREVADAMLSGRSARSVAAAYGLTANTVTNMCRSATWAGLQTADRRMSEAEAATVAGRPWRKAAEVLMVDGSPVALLGGEDARVVTPAERERLIAMIDARTGRAATATGTRKSGRSVNGTLVGGRDGVARCGLCGRPMVAAGTDGTRTDAAGRVRVTRAAYRCHGVAAKLCPGTTISRADLDAYVWQALTLAVDIARDDSPLWQTVAARLAAATADPAADARRAASEAEHSTATAALSRVLDMAADGLLTREEARPRIDAARTRVEAATRAVKAATATAPAVPGRRAVRDGLDALDLDGKRVILRAGFDVVTVLKTGRHHPANRPPMSSRVTLDGPAADILAEAAAEVPDAD